MVSLESSAAPTPLTRAQADDVLRYWLSAVRLEETLKVRPRARRVKHAAGVPRLDLPALGQDYFKLPLGAQLAALLESREPMRRPFDGELTAFFEGWLYSQYRRAEDESELSHLLCFPVVHLPRGELAGLLRCGVRLRFGSAEGKLFRAPSRAERARNAYPAAPDEARIASVPRSEGSWPFFVDTRLLSYPLGLSSEEIDRLFDELRARDELSELAMIELVTRALERAGSETESATAQTGPGMEAWLGRLNQAMQVLLARASTRAEVYPVGIVIDGTQAKTTWHLQRELLSLSEAQGKDAYALESCLGAYLTSTPCAPGEDAQRALFSGPPLTTHQRAAAASFWGSTVTSVQGPPGTGKTTLILHLCAEALVRQVTGLLVDKLMGAELLLIASGNNRAVDNVIEPLSLGSGLPLALRVGSRQVCEQTLSARLRQTASWLKHAQVEPLAVRNQELERALALFASHRDALDELLAPRREALKRASQRERLSRTLAALPAPVVEAQAARISSEVALALEAPLGKLERRLQALSKLCEGKPGMAQVNAIARHYEKTARRELPALESALAEAGLALEVPLPPLETPLDVSALMDVWDEGAEQFLSRLAALREQVEQTLATDKLAAQRAAMQSALATLGPAEPLPEPVEHDELSRGLFLSAVAVREAWAQIHAKALQEAVELALSTVEQERSLRPLFRHEPEQATLLCRLFGIWGSTLLSLGNCLPMEADSVARVVIDEAGQCHPAHAVSALMRARSAMVIGDVFQLAPVIELSADDEARLVRSLRLKTTPVQLARYRVSSDSQVSAQSLADHAVARRHALVDHFRCQPEIIAVSNALCGYGLSVHTLPTPLAQRLALLQHPVQLCDLQGQQERVAGSLYNELELGETLRLLERLLASGVRPAELALITPYRGQLERLRRGLHERRVPLEFSPELADSEGAGAHSGAGLALGTVHRFQGGERRIVLFSSVITRTSSLGFLNARPNLLNVAISRAQQHFVCLGDRSVLARGPMTRLLVEASWPLELSPS